ncbi:MAG: bifunctional glutamate N-acetyltransferase/amino-acid acetyltransferase ArgJ [Fimbriimonadaceae bacterium]|nr:bifunctional glutamate N-acetyltransferase/amino-acid acetyltransferase ArgJ [Fimbriimonadaceae bacterium]
MHTPMQRLTNGDVTTPQGFRAAGARAGIKPSGKPDLAVLVSDRPCAWTGVFTTNRVHAYNVARHRRLLAAGQPLQAVLVSSGNANVATGAQGAADTDELAALTAAALGLPADQVGVAQTGVIGVPLPMPRIRPAIAPLCAAASTTGGAAAAEAICTTDTRLKQAAVELDWGGTTVRIGAMAKGAGMIHPNMATLLCFVTTDAAVAPAVLQAALQAAVADTLNCISIDGDQSTSDTCLLLAHGQSGAAPLESVDDPRWSDFVAGLTAVLDPLAAWIAGDGEGATKLLQVLVTGALDAAEARLAARAVAASNLFKCAVAGGDPNWGRIACAAGYSGAQLDPARLGVRLNGVPLLQAGEPLPFEAAAVSASMAAEVVTVEVDLGVGAASGHAYGCDLTTEYVRFNAEYTT